MTINIYIYFLYFLYFLGIGAHVKRFSVSSRQDWVNSSKRGGMDRVFQGLAGLPCQPKENPVHPDSFTWLYILFKIGHFGDISDFFKNDV